MSQTELLRDVVALLNKAGIPYMVVGSYASSFYGEPRMTRDIDIVVDPAEDALRALDELVDRDRFYLGDPLVALRNREMFNLIEPASGWKVDFVIRKDRPFSKVEFERRLPASIAGVSVLVASAEDVALSKLERAAASGSDRQIDDVEAIVLNCDLDRVYLTGWATRLGVDDALAQALEAADSRR